MITRNGYQMATSLTKSHSPPQTGKPIDVVRGKLLDAPGQPAQVLAPEPGLGQGPVVGVVRIVHRHQRPDQVTAPE